MSAAATLPQPLATPTALVASIAADAERLRKAKGTAVYDATGINLRSAADLQERAYGQIRDFDPRMCVYDPDRVLRAEMRREARMRWDSMARYLAEAADTAEVIVSLEANGHPGWIDTWRRSAEYRRLGREVAAVAAALRRMRGSDDLMRAYGAARTLAKWLRAYESALYESGTRYSHRLAPHAGKEVA
jgi:hypothetical protein